VTNPSNPLNRAHVREAEKAATALGIRLQVVEVRDPDEFERALVPSQALSAVNMASRSCNRRAAVHGSRGSRENLNESRVCNPWRFQGGPSLSLHEPRCTHRNGAFK
jgi:hypothetical protein